MKQTDPGTARLDFSPVMPDDYDRIFPFSSGYGEGSCQFSPVSMYSQSEKYGDSVCIKDGSLFTLRKNLCDDQYRVYLPPLGNCVSPSPYAAVLADARTFQKRVQFVSLTEKQATVLEKALPDRFDIRENRGLAEYMYRTEDLAALPGSSRKKQRNEVSSFRRFYGQRASVSRICPDDFEDILSFEQEWVLRNKSSHDAEALEREARMIGKQLAAFAALHLSGIVLRIDGVIKGFSYGTKLSDVFYDAIAEKGDKNVPHVYKILRQESARLCASCCPYINLEEDLDIPGLRSMKLNYKPAYLLRKYIAVEKPDR